MKGTSTALFFLLAASLNAQQPQALTFVDTFGKPRHDAVAFSPSGQSLFVENKGLIYKAYDPAGEPEKASFKPILKVRNDLSVIKYDYDRPRFLLPLNDRLVVYIADNLYLLDSNLGETLDTWERPEEFFRTSFASISPDQKSIGVTFGNIAHSIHLFTIEEDRIGLSAKIDVEGVNPFFTYHPTDGTILTTHELDGTGPGNYKTWSRDGVLLETNALTDVGSPVEPTQVTINAQGELIEVVARKASSSPFPPLYTTQYVVYNAGTFSELREPSTIPLIPLTTNFPRFSNLSPDGRFVIFPLGAVDTMAGPSIRRIPGVGNAANTAFKSTHSYLYSDQIVSISPDDPRDIANSTIATFTGAVRYSRVNNTLASTSGALNLSTRDFMPVPLDRLGVPKKTILGNSNSWQIQTRDKFITLYRYSDLEFPFFEHEEFYYTPSWAFQVIDDEAEEATMVIVRRKNDNHQDGQDLIVAEIRGASKELKLLEAALPLLNLDDHFIYLRGDKLIVIERTALLGQSASELSRNYKVSLESGEAELFTFDPLDLDHYNLDPEKITDYDDHFMISNGEETRHVLVRKDDLKPVLSLNSDLIAGASYVHPGSIINDGILPVISESEVLFVSIETGLATARIPNQGFQDASVNGDRAFLTIDDGALFSYEFPTVTFATEDPLIQQLLGKSRLVGDRDNSGDGMLDVADLMRR